MGCGKLDKKIITTVYFHAHFHPISGKNGEYVRTSTKVFVFSLKFSEVCSNVIENDSNRNGKTNIFYSINSELFSIELISNFKLERNYYNRS